MSANHGSTPAAWTGVGIVLLGFLVGGLGLVFETLTVFWIGVVLALAGGLVGAALAKMGFGGEPPAVRR